MTVPSFLYSSFMQFMNNDFYEKYGKQSGLSKEAWNMIRAVAGIKVTTITPQAEHDEVDDLIDDLL